MGDEGRGEVWERRRKGIGKGLKGKGGREGGSEWEMNGVRGTRKGREG